MAVHGRRWAVVSDEVCSGSGGSVAAAGVGVVEMAVTASVGEVEDSDLKALVVEEAALAGIASVVESEAVHGVLGTDAARAGLVGGAFEPFELLLLQGSSFSCWEPQL